MRHHAMLVSVLHIVYAVLHLLAAAALGLLAGASDVVFAILLRERVITPHDVPLELLDVVPFVLGLIAAVVGLLALPGLVAAIAYLRFREWARITLLVVSFFALVNIPLGTLLGGYSIWVLMQEETIRLGAARPPG